MSLLGWTESKVFVLLVQQWGYPCREEKRPPVFFVIRLVRTVFVVLWNHLLCVPAGELCRCLPRRRTSYVHVCTVLRINRALFSLLIIVYTRYFLCQMACYLYSMVTIGRSLSRAASIRTQLCLLQVTAIVVVPLTTWLSTKKLFAERHCYRMSSNISTICRW